MQYKGTMDFASEPDKGTVVTLAFPAIDKPINQVGE
jgi:signal transduction histidine kinase